MKISVQKLREGKPKPSVKKSRNEDFVKTLSLSKIVAAGSEVSESRAGAIM